MNYFLKKMVGFFFFLLFIWTWYKVPGVCWVSLVCGNWFIFFLGEVPCCRVCRRWVTIETVTGVRLPSWAHSVLLSLPFQCIRCLSGLTFPCRFNCNCWGRSEKKRENHHGAWVILHLYLWAKLVVLQWWPALPVLRTEQCPWMITSVG